MTSVLKVERHWDMRSLFCKDYISRCFPYFPHSIMNSGFLKLLSDVCGEAVESPTTESDLFYRMLLLLRFFGKTSPSLWWASMRPKRGCPCCPMCGYERDFSIVHSHLPTCIFLPLCLITNPDDKSRIKSYLKTALTSSASRNVEKNVSDKFYLIMAHMALYPHGCAEASSLKDTVKRMNKLKPPKWYVKYLIGWVMSKPPSHLLPPPYGSIMVSEWRDSRPLRWSLLADKRCFLLWRFLLQDMFSFYVSLLTETCGD